MTHLTFNFRDIFRAPRIAFSFQRLWIQFVGLLTGYAGYVIFTYLGFVAAGKDLSMTWDRFGLLPCAVGEMLPYYGWILAGLGILFLIIWYYISATAVARATYMHLKGNTFYTWKEAMRFALRKKLGSLISTPIAIAVIIGIMVLGGFVIGLLGKIPFAGELGVSLFTMVWYIVSLFLVFVVLALGVSLIMTPSILATTDDDAFEGIFQSFSLLHSQPWRLIIYEIILMILAVVGLGTFAFFAKKAWLVMNSVLVWGMGEKYASISFQATYIVQTLTYPAVAWIKTYLGSGSGYFFFSRDFFSLNPGLIMNISSWITAVFLFFIGGMVLSFPVAICNAGHSIIFLILKKIKDDDNLLERTDKEEEEEEAEPEEVKKEDEVKKPEKKRTTKPAAKTDAKKKK